MKSRKKIDRRAIRLVVAITAISLASAACEGFTPHEPDMSVANPNFAMTPVVSGGVACEEGPGGTSGGPEGPQADCFWEGLATAGALAQCGGSVATLIAVVSGSAGTAAPGAIAASVYVQGWCIGAAAAVGKFIDCLDGDGDGDDVGPLPVAAGPLADTGDPLSEVRKKALENVLEYNGYAKEFNEIVDDYKLDVNKLELLSQRK